MQPSHRKRSSRRVPLDLQRAFGFTIGEAVEPVFANLSTKAIPLVQFEDPSPSSLRLGDMLLADYLRSVGQTDAIDVREVVRQVDLTPVLHSYKPGGRHPIHPAILLGLVIYGMLQKAWSLRELEALARRDLGAFFVCGGLQPDFTTIAKFLTRHAAFFSDEFFMQVTRQLLAKLGASKGIRAGDGTVIQAVASHYSALKREAAVVAAKEAAAKAAAAPKDERLQGEAAAAQQIDEVAAERAEKNHGRYSVRVAPSEPEAVFQPMKNGPKRFGYKPSIIVDDRQLIVAQHMHPSNEVAALEPLLDQHLKLFGANPSVLTWDAAQHAIEALEIACRRDLNLLSPGGSARTGEDFLKGSKSKFIHKSAFTFDEYSDRYTCPVGKALVRRCKGTDEQGPFVRYRCAECGDCSMRPTCTKSGVGRTVKRYEGDELKDAMDRIMEHPQAREQYRHRRELVEPVFAVIKGRLGLTRFRRRGTAKVAMEFALVCVAYNVRKAAALMRRLFSLFAAIRHQGARSCCTGHRGTRPISCLSVPG